jgi:uncharacterized protein (TIGR00255 family)
MNGGREVMISSMTGYGSAKGTIDKLEVSVELRSVNSRFLDCSVKIPRLYAFAEEQIKSQIQSCVLRGKVDVYVNIDSFMADDVTIKLNEPLAQAYIEAFKMVSEKFGVENDVGITALSRLQDVFVVEKKEVDADLFLRELKAILGQALEGLMPCGERKGRSCAVLLSPGWMR